MTEADGPPSVQVADLAGSARALVKDDAGLFPGPVDPRGTHALLVRAQDRAGVHREQLVLVPLAGGPPRALTPTAGVVRNPAWTPAGDAVIFESDGGSYRDLYRVARAGGPLQRLTDAPHGSFEPTVGPQGRVAFGSSRDGNAEIYAMDADGRGVVRLTQHPADDLHPAWGAERIAWITAREGAARVWTMNADGSDARPLRPGSDEDRAVGWSPDGATLAVVTGRGAEVAVELWPWRGGRPVRLDGPGVDEQPTWSPDGQWVAWSSARAGNPDLWIARADGSDARAVTSSGEAEWLPRWTP